jgi:two-component system, chemotaxis family, protein-glutamate methylesterase/glutaminase
MLSQGNPKTEAMIQKDKQAQAQDGRRGMVSVLSCPECGGVLWQEDDETIAYFRCHTGHSYLGEQLLVEQGDRLEAALWTAVRIFREREMLARQLATKARQRGEEAAAPRYDEQADQAGRYAALILEKVLHAPTSTAIAGEPPKALPASNSADG